MRRTRGIGPGCGAGRDRSAGDRNMKLVCRGASRYGLAPAVVVAAFSILLPCYTHGDRGAAEQPATADSPLLAAIDVECVSDEVKYWRMRNLLLARAGLWSSGETIESFAALAADAGLEP